MTSIANSTASNFPVRPEGSHAAWREEMLGQILNSMRERKLPVPTETAPAEKAPRVILGKGHYVDLYV